MKQFSSWTDLEPYGIDMLTGESCAYGYRVLCDLTEDGIELVANCLGIQNLEAFKLSLPEAWNTKGIRSIMLSPGMFQNLSVFACFDSNCSHAYIMYSGSVIGVEQGDQKYMDGWINGHQASYCEACDRYGKGGGIQHRYANPGFSRNTHQMSGRTS